MLATYAAGNALAAALAVPGLPAPQRNDVALSGFLDAGNGIGWKLAVNDEGWGGIADELGDPPQYEIGVRLAIALAIEGEAGPARDAVQTAAMAVLAATLFPGGKGLTAGGLFDDLTVEGDVQHDLVAPGEQGAAPIVIVQFTVSLVLTAPTPFG